MKQYPKYKSTDIPWLGEIPEHWEVRKLGNILSPISEKNHPGLPLLSITREEGVILRDIEDENSNHNFIPDDLSNYKKVEKGDFGMNKMKAWQGSYGVSDYNGIVSPAYYVFKFKTELNKRFFHLAVRSKRYVAFLGSASDGIRIGQWDLSKERMKKIPVALPPLPEQRAIADFLDEKTARIEDAIRIKEREIELLKERRQIIIQEVVTGKKIFKNGQWQKPDKTKPSGVDWMGEIPEDWEVRKLKHLFIFTKGLTITKENLRPEGIYCINYSEIHSKYGFEVDPFLNELKCVDPTYLDTDLKSLLNKGDFVFADTSEDLEGAGNFTYLKSDADTFSGYHTIIAKPINKLESRFYAYEFESLKFRFQIRKKMNGVKVFSITQSILKNLDCWIPGLSDQIKIVEYLDHKMEEISNAISVKSKEIEKLKEYKTVLIDHVVTGKVRVSG